MTGFEAELRRLNVRQKNSRPNHPTTCGKVERFQQTMLGWLRAQPRQPGTLDELQPLLDLFASLYNQQRPHRSLPHRATPAAVYHSLRKAAPINSHELDHHHRVRRDVIDSEGKVTSAMGAASSTSVSAEPTPEPPSSCSSKTSTSASSTR